MKQLVLLLGLFNGGLTRGPRPRAPHLSACEEAPRLVLRKPRGLFICNYCFLFIKHLPVSLICFIPWNLFIVFKIAIVTCTCKYLVGSTTFLQNTTNFKFCGNFAIQLIDSWGPAGHIGPGPRFTLICPWLAIANASTTASATATPPATASTSVTACASAGARNILLLLLLLLALVLELGLVVLLDGTVVVHLSLTSVTEVRLRLLAVISLQLPLSHVRQLSQPIIAGFLRVFRFPPVVTLDPLGVALTHPLGRTAQEAHRIILYK